MSKASFKKVNSTPCTSPRDRNMQRGTGQSPHLCLCLKTIPLSCCSPLTSAALRCWNCPFWLESTVAPNHPCGSSATEFCSCSWLISIPLGYMHVLMYRCKKKVFKKKILHWPFEIFKPGEMKKNTVGKAKLLAASSGGISSYSNTIPTKVQTHEQLAVKVCIYQVMRLAALQHTQTHDINTAERDMAFCGDALSVSVWVPLVPPQHPG